jgi:arylsulfatase A-like enzyme
MKLSHLLLCPLALALSAQAAPHQPPNFVFILGEAQGWASMSAPLDDRDPNGSKSDYIQTPSLDRLAALGARFSDFYASSPRCTPSRATFFCGLSPARLHMTFVGEGKEGGVNPGDKVICPVNVSEMPRAVETIGELLQKHGYATAHFGKWHAGRLDPKEHGFAENDGPNSNGGPENVTEPNPKQAQEITRLGLDFMSRQAQAHKPFYLQVSHYPGRGMNAALPETIEQVKQRLQDRIDVNRIGTAAGAADIDATIGRILDQIEALGIADRTYIFYSADHGAQGKGSNGTLSNGKGTVWEGGVRVPLLFAGPGIPKNQFLHTRTVAADLYPTVAELAGISPQEWPANLEGTSLVSLLSKGAGVPLHRPREEYVIHFPHYDKDQIGPASAILLGRYKLIRIYETGQQRLFDLSTDPAEQTDLSTSQPKIATELDHRLTAYLTAVNAGLPTPNPNYDPNGARSGDRRGGSGGAKGGGGGGKKGMGKGKGPTAQPSPAS